MRDRLREGEDVVLRVEAVGVDGGRDHIAGHGGEDDEGRW